MVIGDIVYYARVIPYCDIYEICELRIRTVKDGYFVGIDKRDKHAYCFNLTNLDVNVFYNRSEALAKVKEAEKTRKAIKKENEEDDEYSED